MEEEDCEYFGSAAEAVVAARQCELAVVEFTSAFDLGDYEGMARYMALDGVWKRQDGDIRGHEQLKRFMNARGKGLFVRHVLGSMRTRFTSPNSALVHSYVTAYRHEFPELPILPAPLGGPHVVGRYQDQLHRGNTGWKLVCREVRIDFKQR